MAGPITEYAWRCIATLLLILAIIMTIWLLTGLIADAIVWFIFVWRLA